VLEPGTGPVTRLMFLGSVTTSAGGRESLHQRAGREMQEVPKSSLKMDIVDWSVSIPWDGGKRVDAPYLF
jgi:hypothetical protein